jgi:hypothetical protein
MAGAWTVYKLTKKATGPGRGNSKRPSNFSSKETAEEEIQQTLAEAHQLAVDLMKVAVIIAVFYILCALSTIWFPDLGAFTQSWDEYKVKP